MSVDIDAIVAAWEIDEPLYNKLGKELNKFFKNGIFDLEMFPQIEFRTKDILSIVRKIKKKNLTNSYGYADLKDKLGFRIVCSFSEDMEVIDNFLQANFKVHKADKKRDLLDHNRLDYISNHYDLSINSANLKLKKLARFDNLIFEVQVRTLNQHAWSNTSHALSYKQEANISSALKRRVFRLLSLYEIADDEFSIVNNVMRNDPNNLTYSLLRKTEGKIYKYAKTDFDREASLNTFNILREKFFNQEELSKILKGIEGFISENEQKIRGIFNDNRKRYFKIPFLTQPEIFTVWFALENFEFSVTDNWCNYFDEDDLKQIQTLWGKIFD